jgi:transcription termination/antitermination protein NusA
VREVLVDDEAKQATVIVPDDQLSLAIGKDGLNARLAARLTGWRVDIRSETEFAEEEATMGYDEEEVSGRCAAILANGKRCPNASLPGSRYCGLPAHQALSDQPTDYVVPPEEGGEEAVEDVLTEEPTAEELIDGQPSVDELVGDEPAAEEVLEGQPAPEEVVGEQASVEEVIEEEPAVEEVVTDPVTEPVADSVVDEAPVEDAVGGAPAEPAEPDAARESVGRADGEEES